MENYSVKSNILMIILAIAIIIIIPFQIDGSEVADSLGARFVPYLGSCLILIPNALQLLRKLIKRTKAEKKEKPREEYGNLVLAIVMAFATTFLVDIAGYVISCCLLVTGMLLMFKEKRWYFYAISYALVALIYIGFTKFLYVPLPALF